MKLNDAKFEVMHYGETLGYDYFNCIGNKIDVKKEVKDLGVLMTDSGDFHSHYRKIIKEARNKMSWILRVFETRELKPMLTLYRSLVVPRLEYCSQLWTPWKQRDVLAIESIQRTFTSKIIEVRHLNYWERLKALDLYSLERRRERYVIIYIWKIKMGLTPNINGKVCFRQHQRLGLICERGSIKIRAKARVYSQKVNFITCRGPRLFNVLPTEVRSEKYTTLSSFKRALDEFLQTVPDQPKLPHYSLRVATNSLVDQVPATRRW